VKSREGPSGNSSVLAFQDRHPRANTKIKKFKEEVSKKTSRNHQGLNAINKKALPHHDFQVGRKKKRDEGKRERQNDVRGNAWVKVSQHLGKEPFYFGLKGM